MGNVVLFDEITRAGKVAIPGDKQISLDDGLDNLERDLIRTFITGVQTGEISLREIVSYLDGLQDFGIHL